MKYSLMLLIALLLAGCSSAVPSAQGYPPAEQSAVAQPSVTNAPEPTTTTTIPTSASETAAPAASNGAQQAPTPTVQQIGQISPTEVETIIAPTAQQAIQALRNRDMVRIAGMAHPEKGVLFSPYGSAQATNVILKADQLSGALADSTIYTWGSYDGTGEPIELTFADYFERFVYSQDFAQAPQIGYNQVIGGQYRAEDFDPSSVMVEYHFPGFEPRYEGMDWQSLRLVFEQQEQGWYLVGIIHNQWMI